MDIVTFIASGADANIFLDKSNQIIRITTQDNRHIYDKLQGQHLLIPKKVEQKEISNIYIPGKYRFMIYHNKSLIHMYRYFQDRFSDIVEKYNRIESIVHIPNEPAYMLCYEIKLNCDEHDFYDIYPRIEAIIPDRIKHRIENGEDQKIKMLYMDVSRYNIFYFLPNKYFNSLERYDKKMAIIETYDYMRYNLKEIYNNLTQVDKLFILDQILEGIIELQRSKISHNDLHADNILLDDNYNVKICDFTWATIHNLDNDRAKIRNSMVILKEETPDEDLINLYGYHIIDEFIEWNPSYDLLVNLIQFRDIPKVRKYIRDVKYSKQNRPINVDFGKTPEDFKLYIL